MADFVAMLVSSARPPSSRRQTINVGAAFDGLDRPTSARRRATRAAGLLVGAQSRPLRSYPIGCDLTGDRSDGASRRHARVSRR